MNAGREVVTRAFWVCAPRVGELREVRLAAPPAAGRSLVRAELSGISPGTERLVGCGQVPREGAEAMRCLHMDGGFELPVKYGYCLVGHGEAGALEGQRVFVMHPHQELAEVLDENALPLPDALPSARALLLPNLETALNAVWDAELAAGEPVVVVGAGVVGLLVAFVLASQHEGECTLVDTDAERLAAAAALPWVARVSEPAALEPGAGSVAFHASGNPLGLQTSLDAVGFEGRVVELSWYGAKRVELDLGTSFHYQRKRILASQVATIARAKRDTHGFAERTAEVLALLNDPALDRLLTEPIPFEDLPAFMGELYRGRRQVLLPAVRY